MVLLERWGGSGSDLDGKVLILSLTPADKESLTALCEVDSDMRDFSML